MTLYINTHPLIDPEGKPLEVERIEWTSEDSLIAYSVDGMSMTLEGIADPSSIRFDGEITPYDPSNVPKSVEELEQALKATQDELTSTQLATVDAFEYALKADTNAETALLGVVDLFEMMLA